MKRNETTQDWKHSFGKCLDIKKYDLSRRVVLFFCFVFVVVVVDKSEEVVETMLRFS